MSASQFTWNNFYIFLIELAFSILFLLMFSSIHYGITRSTKLGNKLVESKKLNFIYFFLFGFLLSSLTFIVSQVSTMAIGAIGMPLTIIGLIYAMTIFYNRSVQIGAIIPSILWVLYQYNGFTTYSLQWLLRIVILLIIAIVAIATTFIKWKAWPTFLLSCLTSLTVTIIIIVCCADDNVGFYCTNVIVSITATILYYAVIRAINRFLTQMSTMAKQGVYIDKHFIIPTVLNEYFVDYVKKNNISQALIVSFSLKVNDKQKQDVLDELHDLFSNDKALFFKSEYNTYGVVLSGKNYFIQNLNMSFDGNKMTNRTDYDDLKLLQSKLSIIRVPIKAYVSIYGVHSCNLDELLKFNDYVMKHDNLSSTSNIIQLFSSKMTQQEAIDDIAYSTLTQKVNLSDIDVELELIKMNKSKQIYVCPRFYWPKLLTCDIKTITSQFEPSIADTLLRTLAIKSIELYANSQCYTKYPLLVYYPINQLNNSLWSAIDLKKKIHLYGVSSNNIILSFDLSQYSYLPKQIITSLKDLETNNIKYFLVDVKALSSLKHVNPTGVILDKSVLRTVSKSKLSNLNLL